MEFRGKFSFFQWGCHGRAIAIGGALFGGVVCTTQVGALQSVPTPQDLNRHTLTADKPSSEPPLDLKTAVAKALAANNQIRQARARIEQDQYDVGTTRASLFPTLSAVATSGEYKANVMSGVAPFGGTPYNQYGVDLRFSQPVFAWGSLSALRVAHLNTKLNELDLEIAERTLTNQVIQTFYKVLLNQRVLEILERIQGVINESLATAQRRLQTGRGQLLDVLQVKTQIAILKPQIEDAHNQLESAGAQLATYLAEQGKYELQVRGSLKGVLLKGIEKRLDMKAARLPELERVRTAHEQLSEQKDVVLGKHIPYLALGGDYGYTSFTKSDLFADYGLNWSVYLQLTIPLFSGFQAHFEQRSLTEQDRQIEFQGRDLENTLALNEIQSLKTVQSTGASLLSSQEAADLAEQSLAEARRNFRLATIDFLQFLQVEQSTLQADQSLENIKYNNIVALANYFVATGQPLAVLIDFLGENKQ